MRTTTLLLALTLTLTLAATATAASTTAPPRRAECPTGALCLWEREDFRGARRIHELHTTDIDSCVPLPPGTTAQALANRTGRPVTTYQSPECAETGEFETYPGSGTWVPASPYLIRAFKLWES
ncbi:peptidase inhibitor family I36 protein [Streptomyces yaizuensis]|uniref:Peptidase inhibitor family I36 protein n=1 Tax=Streptomyces yaizuensis TaxID=2989713 RepID=A0ABQ5NU31_9ACTN|nr:peptidase inhibitor family I36 protein [Streptomyces sp. YSPA8]GLF93871.1 peptidase inhibitor family I36 protein [Streptomyces sp. YSPA8]